MPRETQQQRSARLTLYQAYTESGQTIAEFSRERGTTPWRVRHAIRKAEGEASGKSGFQEVAVAAQIDGSAEYGVTLKNGRELRIPAHFTEKRVRQLVEILETC
jgi:hypothetical protein